MTIDPQTKIAICFPTIFSVRLQNIPFPLSSKVIVATGCPSCDCPTDANLKYAPFKISFVVGSLARIHAGLSLTTISSIVYVITSSPTLVHEATAPVVVHVVITLEIVRPWTTVSLVVSPLIGGITE